MTGTPNCTIEQKEAYRLRMMRLSYERAEVARGIIREAYHRAHPSSRRHPSDGILSCGMPITHEPIKVYLDEHGHEYHDRKSCNSWACPICAPKLANKRAREIEQAILAADERGFTQLFVTFTVPHRESHTTAYVIERLNACYNKFLQRKPIREIKREYGYVGAIKCLDYTLTEKGTHAHFHCVFVFDTTHDCFDMLRRVGETFLRVYADVVRRECKQEINKQHGFNIEKLELDKDRHKTAERAAHYAAKAISVYCVDHDKDKGKLTPFDLLRENATEQERARFLDFYRGQKGRRHVLFSRGLRDRLGIKQGSDGGHEGEASVVAVLEYKQGCFLREERRRAEFEFRLSRGITEAVRWLRAKTRGQQAHLAGQHGVIEESFFDIAPVWVSSEHSATDLRRSDLADAIPAASADGNPPLRSFKELRELAAMTMPRRAAERYISYLDRVERGIEEERRRARREGRAELSGLGRALALAAANDPPRDSLFFTPEELRRQHRG